MKVFFSSLAGAGSFNPFYLVAQPKCYTPDHNSSTTFPPLLACYRNLLSPALSKAWRLPPSPASPPSSSSSSPSQAPWQGRPNQLRYPELTPDRLPMLLVGGWLVWTPPAWLWPLQFILRGSPRVRARTWALGPAVGNQRASIF